MQASPDSDSVVLLAKLGRDAYLDAVDRLERKVFKVLAMDTDTRSKRQIELLFEVSFQWKNPDFLLRNTDFRLKSVDL